MILVRSLCAAVVALVLGGAADAHALQFGVYKGAGCNGRAAIPGFETFAGHKVERVVDALSQESWPALDSSIDWIVGCWKGSGLALTLSVPMMPKSEGGTFEDGSNGAHDAVFRHVAEALVAAGYQTATVRIGWEMNGDWMPWSAQRNPDGYISYFRRIVAVMRKVKGADFQFDWCPNHRRHAIDPSRVYPGDDVVDLIGMDVYDEVWNPVYADARTRWTWYRQQPFGLDWHRTFAADHGKPLAYDEWGAGRRPDGHGAGDDPVFIAGMADWFAEAKPLYENYWDYPSTEFDAQLSSGRLPLSASAFVARFAPLK